jgi:hypothetical protein
VAYRVEELKPPKSGISESLESRGDDFVYCDLDCREHSSALGLKEPSFDQYPRHRRRGLRLVLRFSSKLEGSADSLSSRMIETVWVWLNFSMFFLSESASDEAMGCRTIVLSQGPYNVEMVGSSHLTRDGHQPHFLEDFFSRLDQEILVVDDYGYAGIDFHNDPDLVLPEGEDWDTSLVML